MHAAQVIKEARRRAGLTQEELAERAGTSQSLISRYESRRGQPSFAMVERIVAAAGQEMQIDLATRIVPLGGGPMGQALSRARARVAQVLLDAGVTEAEIAGDLAIGDDIPGATLLFLVRPAGHLGWMDLTMLRGRLELELGCTAAVEDADASASPWAAEMAGPRMAFPVETIARQGQQAIQDGARPGEPPRE